MAWSYSANPQNNTTDAVRVLISDVNTNRQLVQDDIIAYALSRVDDDVDAAALEVLDHIIMKFASMGKFTLGTFEVDSGEIVKEMTRIRDRMQASAGGAGSIYASGLSVSGKLVDREDSDVIQHPFQVDMHKNSQSG